MALSGAAYHVSVTERIREFERLRGGITSRFIRCSTNLNLQNAGSDSLLITENKLCSKKLTNFVGYQTISVWSLDKTGFKFL